MSTVEPEQSQLDASYEAQRLRLKASVVAGVAAAWTQLHNDRQAAVSHVVRLVTVGQAHTARLVDAYMTSKTLQATGIRPVIALDPARYTIDELRRVAADSVYSRPFGAYGALLKDGAHPNDALRVATSSVTKLAATDLQLAQTHAARDWMTEAATGATGATGANADELRIVGYRRVLSGPGPHCALCTAASTRTYRVADLMAIHEHCTCGVQPLYGIEPVASVGTTVRVDNDPELGPRLMADDWSPVGPRLTV